MLRRGPKCEVPPPRPKIWAYPSLLDFFFLKFQPLRHFLGVTGLNNKRKKVAYFHIYGQMRGKLTSFLSPLWKFDFTPDSSMSPLLHTQNFQNTLPIDLSTSWKRNPVMPMHPSNSMPSKREKEWSNHSKTSCLNLKETWTFATQTDVSIEPRNGNNWEWLFWQAGHIFLFFLSFLFFL